MLPKIKKNLLITNFITSYTIHYRGLSKSCWIGIFLCLIQALLAGVYYFFPIYFVSVLKFDIKTSSLLVSCYGLGTIVGGIVGGKLTDRFSALYVLMLSLIAQGSMFLLLIILKSIFFLFFDLFLLGFFSYSFITSNYLWVLGQCANKESEKLKAINILSIASNLGLGLSSVLVGIIASIDFKYIFISSGTLLISITLIFLMVYRRKKNNQQVYIQNSNNKNAKIQGMPFLKQKMLYLIIPCLFFTGMIVSQINATYPIYLEQTFPELGFYSFSILFSLNAILIIFFQNVIVNRILGKNKILWIGIGSFLIGAGMWSLNSANIFAQAIVSCIMYSLGEMIFFSIIQLFFYQHAGEKKGSSLGIYRMIYASSRFIGPTIGGFIYSSLGASYLWSFCGTIGIFFLFLCNYFKKDI